MNAIVRWFKTLASLFFDDGSLALAILALLVWVTVFARGGLAGSSASLIALLVGGTLLLLSENVVRTVRRHSERPGAPEDTRVTD
jgi:hypothetical protein